MALVCAAVLVGAVLQSATGFGFALITAPALFVAFDPGEALTVLAVLGLTLSMLVLTESRERAVDTRAVPVLCAWAVPGMAIGVVVLSVVDKPVLQVAVGVAVIAAAASDFQGREGTGRPWPRAPVGLLTGVLTTTTGVNGPPLLMYFGRAGASPDATRDSLAACFAVFSPLSVIALAIGGQVSIDDVGLALLAALLLLVLTGRPLGRAIFLRLAPHQFRRAGLALAMVAGLGSIAAGLAT